MTSARELAQVTGGAECALNVASAGPIDGSLIVAIHGIGQSLEAYAPLLDVAAERGWRVVAFDLRGHGESDKPADAYGDSVLWAEDLAAVLAASGATPERPATVLAWSYGGVVLTDYLTAFGGELVGAIVTLGATTKLGAPVGPFVQPAFGALGKAIMTDDSGAVAADLLDMCAANPLNADYRSRLLAEALKCPAYVRNGMFRRSLDNDAALAAFSGPLLATHGDQDSMFTTELSKHLAATAPNGTYREYSGCGHMPLWDATDDFLSDLTAVIGS